eukprot:TRINITY_DN7188_c0_g1_i2.p1 TRINITY_DN7188_c0_g1~~TRINITY_DN7188_c0_g1_i2.p1  ORF type:complete len:451 (+),score=119.14 TRINITY_DN7188_c0_g1_i2:233-1585(+)
MATRMSALKRCSTLVLGRNATHAKQACKAVETTAAPSAAASSSTLLNHATPASIRTNLSPGSQAHSLRALRTNRINRQLCSNAVLSAAVSPEPSCDLTIFSQSRAHSTCPPHLTSDATNPSLPTLEGQRISFVGAGKMAEAILGGIVKSKVIPAHDILTFDPNATRQQELQSEYGVTPVDSSLEAFESANIVILAVKPQHMAHVFTTLQNKIKNPDVLVLSIVAGYTMDQIQRGLGLNTVVRAMPNTPALIQQAVTCWTISPNVSKVQSWRVKQLLQTFGKDIYLAEEEKMDMATALAGSGPALCQLMLEAMIDTGVHMGLPRDQARLMVTQTMQGAVNLTIASTQHPSMLRNDITSPGGTTAAALYEIERGGMRTVMSDSLWAAYRRSRELGGLDSCVGPGRFHYNAQLELPEELVENLQQVTESMNDIKDELVDVAHGIEDQPIEQKA